MRNAHTDITFYGATVCADPFIDTNRDIRELEMATFDEDYLVVSSAELETIICDYKFGVVQEEQVEEIKLQLVKTSGDSYFFVGKKIEIVEEHIHDEVSLELLASYASAVKNTIFYVSKAEFDTLQENQLHVDSLGASTHGG